MARAGVYFFSIEKSIEKKKPAILEVLNGQQFFEKNQLSGFIFSTENLVRDYTDMASMARRMTMR
jgi:hypothetical protein